jgi:hypothetical protein
MGGNQDVDSIKIGRNAIVRDHSREENLTSQIGLQVRSHLCPEKAFSQQKESQLANHFIRRFVAQELLDRSLQHVYPVPVVKGAQKADNDIRGSPTELSSYLVTSAAGLKNRGINGVGVDQDSVFGNSTVEQILL